MAQESETPFTQPSQPLELAVPDWERADERRERIQKLREEKKRREEKAATRKAISSRCSKEHADRDKAKRRTTIQTFFNRGGTAVPKRIGGEVQAGDAAGAEINLLSSDDGGCRRRKSSSAFGEGSSGGASSQDSCGLLDVDGLGVNPDDPLGAETYEEELLHVSEGEASNEDSDDGGPPNPPPLKKAKKSYDLTRKFQLEWAARLPWAESVLSSDGRLHTVKCRVCSSVEGKPKLLAPKLDTLLKHEGRRKANADNPAKKIHKGDVFVLKDCRHQLNLGRYAARPPLSVALQLNKVSSLERKKKKVQFATVFYVLSKGRPMLEYESLHSLLEFVDVPFLPRAHWSDSSGWIMAEFLYDMVRCEIKSRISSADFIAVTCDETTSVDNGSWMSCHAYVCENWERVPYMVALTKVSESPNTNTFLELVLQSLDKGAGVDLSAVQRKLLCFGADGVAAFQGCRTGVTVQLQQKNSPFMIGVHCWAQRINLAAESMGALPIIKHCEQLMQKCNQFFNHSPKRLSEFKKLAEVIETKGLRPLKNVATRWVSLLEPLRRLMSEYRTLIAKFAAETEKADARACLAMLLDPYTLLGIATVIPLLEIVDVLCVFAQQSNVFVCDMVAALKLCEGNLYSLFVDRGNSFSQDEFWSLHGLLDASHESIHLKWVCDLNSAGEAQVAFSLGGCQHWDVHEGQPVSRALWEQLVAQVKDQCAAAASQLISELRSRFPLHSVLDALGIVYPQYWAVPEAESNFKKHLEVLKKFYGERKLITDGENKGQSVEPILDSWQLDAQQGYFKLAMLSNYSAALEPSFVQNPLTRLWRTLDAASVCVYPEYMKLARIAVVHVLGSVQDERCFSTLSFLKNKLRNALDAHLQLVVGMYSQQCYTIQNFPYEECFDKWANAGERYRYLLQD